MVGFEGDRPSKLVRVKAQNEVDVKYCAIQRELDLPERQDSMPWKVGDKIGLHGSSWREGGDAKIIAIITEVLTDQ